MILELKKDLRENKDKSFIFSSEDVLWWHKDVDKTALALKEFFTRRAVHIPSPTPRLGRGVRVQAETKDTTSSHRALQAHATAGCIRAPGRSSVSLDRQTSQCRSR